MMIVLIFTLFLKGVSSQKTTESGATPNLVHVDEIPNIGVFKDAQHRGSAWYDYMSESDGVTSIEAASSSESVEPTSSDSSRTPNTEEDSTSASSFETKERKMYKKTNRVCSPCPHEMIKKHKNIGIKWICGGYQRARRSFKSSCMMRYRNCEDGTMFVKLHSNRCKNDTYHGRHWFYIYKV